MILSRELGKRIWGGSTNTENGGGGVSSDYIAGLLAGYATETWVDEHYISIDFFSRLFQAHGTENGSEIDVLPNDMETTITSVESMFGFWTNLYISALGSNGAAPAGISLGMLTDVTISGTPSAGQVLTFDAVSGEWVNGNAQAGATSLANLTDVILTTPSTNQALIYNGTTWVNSPLKTINGYSIIGTGDIPASGGGTGNYVAKAGDTMSGTLNIHEPDVSALNLKRTALGAVLMRFFADNQSTNGWAVGVAGGNSFVVTHSENGFSTDSISMEMLTNGNIGIGTRNPSTKVHVVGDVTATRYRLASGYIENGSLNEVDLYNYFEFRVRTIYGGREYGYSFSYFYFGPFSDGVNSVDLGRNDGRWRTLYARNANFNFDNNTVIKVKRSNSGGAFVDYYNNNQDSNAWRVGISGDNTFLFAYTTNGFTVSDNVYLEILTNGSVGIGTRYPAYKLHVAGTIYATGSITALSDARKKDITGEVGVTVEQIAYAPAVQFLWKDKERRKDGQQVGTLAQYWQTVLPEVVSDKGGELSMQYGVAALVSSIIIARKVANHEVRIDKMEKWMKKWAEENDE